jgi:hypothetical protein
LADGQSSSCVIGCPAVSSVTLQTSSSNQWRNVRKSHFSRQSSGIVHPARQFLFDDSIHGWPL